MPMPRDNHEALLTELLTGDLDHTRKTEILQELRVDYGTVISEHEDLNKNHTELQKRHDDLVVSNSQLFRQLGTVDRPEKAEENKQAEYSETVTIEQLESKTY